MLEQNERTHELQNERHEEAQYDQPESVHAAVSTVLTSLRNTWRDRNLLAHPRPAAGRSRGYTRPTSRTAGPHAERAPRRAWRLAVSRYATSDGRSLAGDRDSLEAVVELVSPQPALGEARCAEWRQVHSRGAALRDELGQ